MFGEGYPLLLLPHWTSNIERVWQEPNFVAFARALGEVARVIQFDKRGCGASDGRIGSIDDAEADALAVLTAAGARRAIIVAGDLGGFLAMRLAAAHSDVVAGLVLVNTTARLRRADDYEIGFLDEAMQAGLGPAKRAWLADGKATGLHAPAHAPFVEAAGSYRRSSVRFSEARRVAFYLASLDLREELLRIRCPTVVVHRLDNEFMPFSHGRFIAEPVRSARLVELPGTEQTLWAGDHGAVVEVVAALVAELNRGPG